MFYKISILVPIVAFLLFSFHSQPEKKFKEKLSDWNFFEGPIAELRPAAQVIPYTLRTPLFSDYARKARFLYLPEGQQVSYHAKEVFDFPVGTVLIKNFYYPIDARKPERGRQIIETRLLIHEEEGWETLEYVWNDEQTEAYLDLAGDTKLVKWVDKQGKRHKLDYQIPNKNQCKGCHNFNESIRPIGPSARQLNGELSYPDGATRHQLVYWAEQGWLKGLPEAQSDWPQVAIWDDEQSGTLEARARAWLDINCGHCHRPEGPASTSGLFLHVHEQDPAALGIYKTPVAAGRGSGGLKYDILPGNAKKSILIFRMESKDPGIRMPEIARQLVHKEGLELVKDWVNSMEGE